MEDQLVQILENSLGNQALLAILVAFAGGLLSSLSPCVLAILPLMVGYIGGYSEDNTYKAFIQSLLFSVGFTLVLTIVGLFAAVAGQVVGSFIGSWWFIILAIIAIVMGLSLLEVFYINFPTFIKDMPKSNYGKIFSPIILGMAFGTMATPCSTPILIVLISYVAYKGDILFGTLFLASYAFGHSVILLLCGTFTGLVKQIGHFRKWSSYITKISGILLIIIGIYLIIYSIFPSLRIF